MPIDQDIAVLTLDEAKRYLKVDTDTGDEVIATLLNGVSAWMKNYLGRDIISTTFTEYYDGDGSDLLILRNSPVISVSGIYVDSSRIFGAETKVDAANMVVKKQSGIVVATNLFGVWSCGNANIKAVYTAGYTVGEIGTMPNDLKLAAFRILDHQWRTGYTHRKLDVSSESVGDQTTTFRDGDIPADAKRILDFHRRLIGSPQFSYAD